MTKLILCLTLFLFVCNFLNAQQVENSRDSLLKRDSSALEDLKSSVLDNIPVITLDDNDLTGASAQNVSSLLTAGRDPFFNAASYNFSAVRFSIRGYGSEFSSTYINNIPMENIDNGYTPYGLWGGLNDVFRNRDVSFGTRYNTFAFGDIGSTTNIDVRASKQRPQTTIGYSYSNRSYDSKLSFTHSTGLSKHGWAFSVSGSRRYANAGYVPGTYYNGWSWFVAIDKKVGQKQLFSLTAFEAPTENGRQGAATTEMTALSGSHYYNPYWGYQDGKIRNANVSKTNQPVIILSHDYRFNNKTDLTTSVSYLFGENSYSGIDWFNAPDPRPDYYRYLPSYYNDDPSLQQTVTNNLKSSEAARQINWDNLYNINRQNSATIYNVNGVAGNNATGNRSYYILGDRVTDKRVINFNTVINARINNHVNFTGGESYQYAHNNYFQRVSDLLGGSFWVDVNQFALRDFPNNNTAYQNNVNDPNRLTHVGDKYGYNYDINLNKAALWSQFVFTFPHVDFYISAEGSQTVFKRVGNVENGLFPNNSYGTSTPNLFYNYGLKGGITYKINGRNYLYASGALLSHAPFYEDAYVSPRTRDFVQDSLRSETVQNAEAGYVLNAPRLKIHLTGYYTQTKHGFNVLTFYHDDYQDFVNYALSNISRLYFGGEFGFEANVARNLTITGAAAVGRYYYNSRQKAVTTVDNTAQVLNVETIYSNNYRIPSTPQNAYSFSISYRSPKFWFISVTGSYFSNMWISFNPIRRTELATENLKIGSDASNSVLEQQEFKPEYTIDAFAGYSWKLPHTYIGSGKRKKPVYLAMYAGVNNMLNNQNIVSGGYEQLRYDYTTSDISKFPSKYYYAYGINYFASIALRY